MTLHLDMPGSHDEQPTPRCGAISAGPIKSLENSRMSTMDELEDQLDRLIIRILPPMRATKYVDIEAFAQLNELVAALASQLAGADAVPRRFAGKLWLVFTHALTEADHTRSPEEILHYAWAYQDRLENLFLPSSSPPKSGTPRD